MDTLRNSEIQQRLVDDLGKWELVDGKIARTYTSKGWPGTLMLVNTIACLAEVAWHHPELAVSYKSVTVELTTHSSGGVTARDLELAKQIEETLMWRSELPVNGASAQL